MSRARAWVGLSGAALLAVAHMFWPSSAPAQRRSARVSLAQSRTHFDEMREAWLALRALDVQPADANGAVARWDRAWAGRVARAERLATGPCLSLLADRLASPADCSLHERLALLCHPAFMVSTHRRTLYDAIPDESDLPDELEARLAIADEAARRGRQGLSCEDLPDWDELRGSAVTGWSRLDGRPLVPAPSPPASLELSPAQIRDVVHRGREAIQRCYEDAARAVDVRYDAALTIDPSGAVSSIDVRGPEIAGLRDCIANTMRSWQFPTAPRATRVNVPYIFHPREDAQETGTLRSLPPEAITGVVARNREAVQRCYEETAREARNTEEVRVDAALLIDRSGAVSSVEVRGAGFDALRDCIARTIRRWRFPAATEPTNVNVPFVFRGL